MGLCDLDEERQRTKVAEKTIAALNREQSIERQAWDEARTSLHTTQQTEMREWLDQIASERSAKAEAEAEVRVRREQMENVKMEIRELTRAAHVAAGEIARLEERLDRQETEDARIFKTTPSAPKEQRSSRRKQGMALNDEN